MESASPALSNTVVENLTSSLCGQLASSIHHYGFIDNRVYGSILHTMRNENMPFVILSVPSSCAFLAL